MASVRLTNSIRDAIKNKVLKRTFDKLYKSLRKKEHSLAMIIYNNEFSAKEMKLMDNLPTNWLPVRNSFSVKFEEGTLNYKVYNLLPDNSVNVPYHKANYGTFTLIEKESKIEKLAIEYQKEEDEIKSKHAKAIGSVVAILDSVTTVGKLLDVWPEARDFILPYLSKAKCTLPAIQFKEVNKLLNLPPEKK